MKEDKKSKAGSKPKLITSLKEVLGIMETPVKVSFFIDGKECELEVRRALPPVMERRREILRSVQPPWVKERNNYDDLNPQYMAKRDQAVLMARSLTVYLCCPSVAELKPGLTLPEQIHAAITALPLPESMLELIELTAIAGGLDTEVTKRANFSSAAPLEN